MTWCSALLLCVAQRIDGDDNPSLRRNVTDKEGPPRSLQRAGGVADQQGVIDMLKAIRGALTAWWRRNIIADDPHPELSRLDLADRLTDAQLERLVREVREQAREHGRQR